MWLSGVGHGRSHAKYRTLTSISDDLRQRLIERVFLRADHHQWVRWAVMSCTAACVCEDERPSVTHVDWTLIVRSSHTTDSFQSRAHLRKGGIQFLRCEDSVPHHHTPQPFYGPFSGTTRVSRCQKRTSGLYGRLTEADTPTIRLGATPSGLTSAHLHHPPIFTGRMPFLLPNRRCQSTEGN